MAVQFINANQAAVTTGVTTITLTKPTNTANGDVMITSFGIRPNTATITTLAGWTLIRSTANANATANKQASYYKVAANEGASYAWTLAATPAGCCGGIITLRGVAGNSVATSINIENSLAEAVGAATHLTPDVTTTVRDCFLVTAHVCANNDTWTAPAAIGGDKAMDERVDVANATSPMCLGMFTCEHVAASATGQKAATDAGPDAIDVGTSHIMALMPLLPTTSIRYGRTTSRMRGAPAQRYVFRQPYLPFPGAAGAAAFELPGGAGPGTYTLTGQAATLTADRVINAVAGVYTLTGFLATIVAGRALAGGAVAGSYVLTGQAATLTVDRMLNANIGVYNVTGFDATFGGTRVLSADPGSYVITGVDATLLHGFALSADPGAYTLTGQAATLLADRVISANAGSYVLTGQAATLLAARLLVADAGVYVISGVDATLVFVPSGVFELNLEPGLYVLTGNDLELIVTPSVAVTPKPMGWIGVSFRRGKPDKKPELVVNVGESVDIVEAANYIGEKLALEGIEAKDVAGMLASITEYARARSVLESVADYSEPEEDDETQLQAIGIELTEFLHKAQQDQIRLKVIAKRSMDAIIAAILASEL